MNDFLDAFGTVPLPPYIYRKPDDNDEARYQTVYADANNMNSVAAPTAGLHFDNELLEKSKDKGVNIASITLNIEIGTFKPIKQNDVKKHIMHSEKIYLSESNAKIINEASDIFNDSEIIVKVKEPQKVEVDMIRENQIIYTYLHLAAAKELTEGLIK